MNQIKKFIEVFLSWSFPVKFLISSLITSAVGSTYIIFLSEYATYYYAWKEGFRIPAEGTHYLSSTIGAITFLIIILGFLLYFTLILTFKIYNNFLTNHNGLAKSILTALIDNNPKNISAIILASIVGGLSVTLGVFLSENEYEIKQLTAVFILGTTFMFLCFVSLWNKKTLITISAGIAIFFSLVSPIILFNTEIYGKIINELGYGGKLPIKIILPDNNEKIIVSLHLRTVSGLFISTKENKQVVEYPIKDIKYIEYLTQD